MKTLLILFLSLALHTFADVPATAETAEALKPGTAVPDVSVKTPEGTKVSLPEKLNGQKTVLVFYRGGWCPYCTRQLSALSGLKDTLDEKGWTLVALSPDQPKVLKDFLKESDPGYTLLSDNGMTAARKFGIAFQVADSTIEKYKTYGINLREASGRDHEQLPVPSVFLVDTNGKIRFTYSNPNYKVRLKSADLLEAIKKVESE